MYMSCAWFVAAEIKTTDSRVRRGRKGRSMREKHFIKLGGNGSTDYVKASIDMQFTIISLHLYT